MLEAIYDIGKTLSNDENKYKGLLTLDRLSRANVGKIIAIKFKIQTNKEVKYQGTHAEDYSGKKGLKTLYSRGSPRGGDYSPTSRITRIYNSLEEKENASVRDSLQRIWNYGWFGKHKDSNKLTKRLKEEYEEKEEKIRKEVGEEFNQTDEEAILTIKIVENGKERYINDYEIFREKLKEVKLESWKEKYGYESIGTGNCVLCDEKKEVLGFAFPFPFYTLDKVSFASNLQKSLSHRKIPICESCALYLKRGKNFLEENTFNFSIPFNERLQYYAIPEFIFNLEENKSSDVLQKIERTREEESDFPILSVEDYITNKAINNPHKGLKLNYIFFTKPQQAQQQIEKVINGVPPSYLNKIKKTFKEILEESYPFDDPDNLSKINLTGYSIKKEDRGYLESSIISIIPDQEKIKGFKERGLTYATDILKEEKIRYRPLLKMFMREMRRRFRNEKKEKFYALNTFIFLQLLNKLNLVGGEDMEIENGKDLELNTEADKFFEEYQEALDSPGKKAAFLQGVITKLFLNIQKGERGSAPFRKRLGGLRLDRKKIRKIYSELEKKYAQYDREEAYKSLRKQTSNYLIEAEENGWDITDEEISYFFSLGLNLGPIFKPNKEADYNE